jgi:hypothetical protein
LRIIAVLAVLFVGACQVEREEFPDEAARVFCPKLKKCEFGAYEANYSADKAVCLEKFADEVDDVFFILDAFCEYDPEAGIECLNKVKKMSCEEFHEGEDFEDFCEDIYGDCGVPE